MSAEVLQIDIEAAQRRAERIRLHATNANEAMQSLQKLVHTARELEDHVTLGFPSWTAYITDLFGDEPLRLARDVRRELVAELSEAGMSTRAIAPIVGVSQDTVVKDINRGERNLSPEPIQSEGFIVNPSTGELLDAPAETTEHTVTEKVKTVTGLDGKEYKRPEPQAPRRRPITDAANDLGWELRKRGEKLERLLQDDRFARNKEEMATHLRGHLEYVIRVCQDSLDHLN